MNAVPLIAQPRNTTGKKVKQLRQNGVLPATVYGKGMTPVSIELDEAVFIRTYKQTGETGLINLTVGKDIYPVLVKNTQSEPVSGAPIHIEFQKVNLHEKIKANIPIVLTGESQAVKEKSGTLLQLVNEVEVEALPANLPEHITVDISTLVAVNDHLTVGQLTVPNDVTILTEPEIMVVKIGELLAPEPEPTPETPEAQAETATDEESTDGGEKQETASQENTQS